jgi:O-glycosyl hydrolase
MPALQYGEQEEHVSAGPFKASVPATDGEVRMRGASGACTIALVASLLAHPSAQVTVSVDLGERYQTLEGFGATDWGTRPWKVYDGPFPVSVNMDSVGFFDSLVSELGLTMWRIHIEGTIEEAPRVIDRPETESQSFSGVRGLAAAAQRHNEPLRFACTS